MGLDHSHSPSLIICKGIPLHLFVHTNFPLYSAELCYPKTDELQLSNYIHYTCIFNSICVFVHIAQSYSDDDFLLCPQWHILSHDCLTINIKVVFLHVHIAPSY